MKTIKTVTLLVAMALLDGNTPSGWPEPERKMLMPAGEASIVSREECAFRSRDLLQELRANNKAAWANLTAHKAAKDPEGRKALEAEARRLVADYQDKRALMETMRILNCD